MKDKVREAAQNTKKKQIIKSSDLHAGIDNNNNYVIFQSCFPPLLLLMHEWRIRITAKLNLSLISASYMKNTETESFIKSAAKPCC